MHSTNPVGVNSPPRADRWRPWMWPVVAAAIALVVVAIIVLSPSGMSRLSALQHEQADLTMEVEAARASHAAAEQRVRDLRPELSEPGAARVEAEQRQRNVLEKLAREELGYLAPGEVTVTVPVATP